MQPALPFDYEALDADTRATVRREDDEFERRMAESGTSFILACHALKRIHDVLRYNRPGFGDYCNSKPGLRQWTANRMLHVAEMLVESTDIQVESKEALYLLAAPSTPEAARVEALALAESGEPITYGRAQEIVQNHQPPPEPRQLTFPPAGADPEEGKEESEEVLAAAEGQAEQDLAAWDSGAEDPEEEEPVEDAAPCRPPLPVPPPIPTRAGSWPHSERLVRWLKTISSQLHVIDIELGGIKTLLAERDKWDWRDVREFILPMMAALLPAIEAYRVEIEAHANEQKGR